MIDIDKLTPIEEVSFRGKRMWLKREDFFEIAGVRGGKVRTCWQLSQNAAEGLITAGSRSSPQVNIVAHIAQKLKLPCRVHTPQGILSPEVESAKNCGAEVMQHKAGYNNVIVARAREDAKRLGWTLIPFGMECEEAVNQTKKQVVNIPKEVKRIVIPVGSAMNLSGLLHGLVENNINIPVVGIVVGKDPIKTLNKFAPVFWERLVTLVRSKYDYHYELKDIKIGDVLLDPIYEAKVVEHLKEDDLFWIIGIRETVGEKLK